MLYIPTLMTVYVIDPSIYGSKQKKATDGEFNSCLTKAQSYAFPTTMYGRVITQSQYT